MQDNQMPGASVKGTPPPTVKPNFTPWYVAGLFGVFLVLVIGVLGITVIRPAADNTQLIGTFVSIGLLAIPALISLIKGAENGADIKEYHQAVNSKMDAWIKAAEDNARLKQQVASTETADVTAVKLAAVSDKNADKLAAVLEKMQAQIQENTDARKQLEARVAGQHEATPLPVSAPLVTPVDAVHLVAPVTLDVAAPNAKGE